ncbi:MAG: MFS transporter [Proteobacteria bacterium]|nr:MFS transporter [Pseudomonadota bacterium]
MSGDHDGGVLNNSSPRFVTGVSAFFATMYFIQGVGDPTSGLIAQPVRALLKSWGDSPATIAAFMGLLALPWSLKLLFGLLSDLVPLFGSRRRNYLLISSVSASVGLLFLYLFPVPEGAHWLLFTCLLLPTIGIAFGDVLVDALMVTTGQPLGLTGRLQSVQWTAVNVAMLLTGVVGGYLSCTGRQDAALLGCAILWAGSFVLAYRYAQEAPISKAVNARRTLAVLADAFRRPGLITVCGILFLWSFNPLWVSVLYLHMTQALHFDEQTYGNTYSVFAAGSVVASVLYGVYCRRIRLGIAIHGSIVAGMFANIVYWHMTTIEGAYVVSFVAGAAFMTGLLIQLDVAARLVPIEVAATLFALIMAVTNLAGSISEGVGGWVYERLDAGALAFDAVVVLSTLCAASCWLLMPRLKREVPQWWV